MNYKIIEKNDEIYFKYTPLKNYRKNFVKKTNRENPFGILRNINFN